MAGGLCSESGAQWRVSSSSSSSSSCCWCCRGYLGGADPHVFDDWFIAGFDVCLGE